MTIENQNKLNELEHNEKFNQELANAVTLEEARKVLASYGVEVSAEEVAGMMRMPEEELSENDLDTVAGGRIKRIVGYRVVWKRVPPLWIPVPVMVPIYR